MRGQERSYTYLRCPPGALQCWLPCCKPGCVCGSRHTCDRVSDTVQHKHFLGPCTTRGASGCTLAECWVIIVLCWLKSFRTVVSS